VVALRMIDMLDAQVRELERGLRTIARHQAGCQALMTQFGVGELIALVTLTELGDVRRLSSSRKAVRFASDRHRRAAAQTKPARPRSNPWPNTRPVPSSSIAPLSRCRTLAASSRSFPGPHHPVATLTKTERLQSPRGTTDQPSRRGHPSR
jgi:hypothetical protein